MRARSTGGRYQAPEALAPEVNGKGTHYNACIAPDESFLIACVIGRDDSATPKRPNYYVFFRSTDDRWTEGINLRPEVNFPGASAAAPYVARDGRHLFFGSTVSRDIDLPASVPLTSRRLLEYFTVPGRFSPGECDETAQMRISDNFLVHFMADSNFLYVGIRVWKDVQADFVSEVFLATSEWRASALRKTTASEARTAGRSWCCLRPGKK
jgi:hypothetical protein